MDRDKDRNWDRVTGPEVQGQRDRDKQEGDAYGQTQHPCQSERARCTGTEGYVQGRGRWKGTKAGTGTE